jgi:hypothetical protein
MDDNVVLEKEWCDSFKENHPEMYPLDLDKMKTWSTFQECVDLKFSIINDKFLKCEADIYNGDNFDGHPMDKRFIATLKVPMSFIDNITESIDREFNVHLSGLYKQHLHTKRNEWMKRCAEDILEDGWNELLESDEEN